MSWMATGATERATWQCTRRRQNVTLMTNKKKYAGAKYIRQLVLSFFYLFEAVFRLDVEETRTCCPRDFHTLKQMLIQSAL